MFPFICLHGKCRHSTGPAPTVDTTGAQHSRGYPERGEKRRLFLEFVALSDTLRHMQDAEEELLNHGDADQAEDNEYVLRDGVLWKLSKLSSSSLADEDAPPPEAIFRGTTCGMRPSHRLRACCIHITSASTFKGFILLVITANCFFMLWAPVSPQVGSAEARRSDMVEWASMSIFTLELVLKVIARGLVFHEGAYLRDGWNWLDVAVVAPFWLLLAWPDMPSFASLQLARALRPLRTLHNFPVLRRTIVAFLKAGPALSSVLALALFFYLVFGIVGVEVYSGLLHMRCAETNASASADVHGHDGASSAHGRGLKGSHAHVGEQIEYCASGGGACSNTSSTCVLYDTNPAGFGDFDSIQGAAILLLQAMTFESWTVLMYELVRALPGWSSFTHLYFDFAAALGGFFFVNMFVAVIFDEVMRSVDLVQAMDVVEKVASPTRQSGYAPDPDRVEGDREEGGAAVARPAVTAKSCGVAQDRPVQQEFDRDRRDSTEDAPQDCCGFDGVLKPLGYVTAVAICANIAVLCAPYRGMSESYALALELASSGFTVYFSMECVTKLTVYGSGNLRAGWREYWYMRDDHAWNRLDFTVLSTDLASIALEQLVVRSPLLEFDDGGDGGKATSMRLLRVFRVLRVLRAFKLSRLWEPLNRTLVTMYNAAAPVASLALLIILFTFIFALLGKELFAGRGLDRVTPSHFDTPISALLSVMVLFSAENWADFLQTLKTVTHPGTATLFVVSGLLVGNFVIVNLFVAVLVEAFVRDERGMREKRLKEAASFKRRSKVESSPDDSQHETAVSSATAGDVRYPLIKGSVTCCCLGVHNPLRRGCRAFIATQAWDSFILLLIIISCVTLAYDTPALDPSSSLAHELNWANYALLLLFAIEASLKIVVSGFVGGDASYLADRWNRLDLFVLVSSLAAFCASNNSGASSLIRLLRVLRPLRLVRRVPGMASIFNFFAEVAADVANIAGVVIFFLLVFASTGIQMYLPVDFARRELSFEGFLPAMLLLFVSATGDDWPTFMYTVTRSEMAGETSSAFFFVCWLYIGQWLLMNLFVATVVNTFIRVKQEEIVLGKSESESAPLLMTREQRQWQLAMQAAVSSQRINSEKPPPPPTGELRAWAHRLVVSRSFDYFITFVILVNVGVMAMNYYGIERNVAAFAAYNAMMWACTKVYYIECALKLLGLTGAGYFASSWNRFEFILVVTALLEEFAIEVIGPFLPLPPMLLRVLRIARLLRILRLLRSFAGLRNVLMTLFLSFPSFLNVAALLALVIFMYAVLGVQLFYGVEPGVLLRGSRTFQDVGSASQLLFQCLTGDGWSAMMLDATAASSGFAYGYFISFILLGLLVLANLIVAIILQNFSSLGDLNPDVASKDDIEGFGEKWDAVDTDGNGFIAAEALPSLLLLLDRPLRPLGIPQGDNPNHRSMTKRIVASLVRQQLLPERFTSSGYLTYRFVLDTLVQFSFEHYNELHVDSQIEPPPALRKQSLWSKLRKHLRNDASAVALSVFYASPPERRSVSALVRALTHQGTLGRGSMAAQLRSLTEVIRVQADKVDSIEERLAEKSKSVDRLETRLAEVLIQMERMESGASADAEHPAAMARNENEQSLSPTRRSRSGNAGTRKPAPRVSPKVGAEATRAAGPDASDEEEEDDDDDDDEAAQRASWIARQRGGSSSRMEEQARKARTAAMRDARLAVRGGAIVAPPSPRSSRQTTASSGNQQPRSPAATMSPPQFPPLNPTLVKKPQSRRGCDSDSSPGYKRSDSVKLDVLSEETSAAGCLLPSTLEVDDGAPNDERATSRAVPAEELSVGEETLL